MKLVHLTESDELKDLMLKVRKDAFGSFNSKKLEMVLNALEWHTERRITVVTLADLPSSLVRELAPGSHPNVIRGNLKKDKAERLIEVNCWYSRDASPEVVAKAEATAKAIHGTMTKLEIPSVPAKPKKNKYYYWDVEKAVKHNTFPGNGGEYGFTFKAGYATEVLAIKSPDGKEFEVGKVDPRHLGDNMSDFIRWSGDTTFKQEVLDYLGMESHEATKKAERTRENTGTCGVCGGEYKLIAGHLVHHGFQRPGHGYIVGDCFGVGYQAWEKSKQSVVDYVKALGKMATDMEAKLKKFQDGEIKSINGEDRQGKKIVYTPSHENWDKQVKGAMSALSRDIEYIHRDVEMYKGRLEKWEDQDLPWEKIQKKKASSNKPISGQNK